jgi:methyltransferase family protein
MKLKLPRLAVFDRLLGPFQASSRNRRMRSYVALMDIKEGTSVLDLGGQPMIWDSVPFQINLTILNLPGIAMANHLSHHRIEYVTGDACNVERYVDRTFDTVFSNSVIEHVGSCVKQGEFAREVRRLGKSYWVQTPSKWFPIEAHCGMLFWWFYPKILRRYLIERWRRRFPAWASMVEETTVLTMADLRRLFPEAKIWVETRFGLPKSYVAYFLGAHGERHYNHPKSTCTDSDH